MRVQITKDAFGMTVWPEDEKISFVDGDDIGWKTGDKNKPNNWVPAWIRNKFTFFDSTGKIFTSKQVKKYFPTLGEGMKEGDRFIGELSISDIHPS